MATTPKPPTTPSTKQLAAQSMALADFADAILGQRIADLTDAMSRAGGWSDEAEQLLWAYEQLTLAADNLADTMAFAAEEEDHEQA